MTNSSTHTSYSDSRYSSFSQIFDLLEKGSHISLEGDLDDTITDPSSGHQYSFEQWMLSAFLYEKEPGGDIETRRGIELVLLYDAAMKRLSLGDERLFGLSESTSQMRSMLLKNIPDILIHGRKPAGDMPPPVQLLMTSGAIITNEQNQADRVLLELIRHLDKQKIKTALIIQHPEHMVSTQGGIIDSQSSVAQSIISDFTRGSTHVQCVFLDPRKSFVKQVPEVATYSAHAVISGNTKNDILSLISARSDIPGELQEKIASLGVGMKTRSILEIFSRYGRGEEVLKHLIKARTKGIVDGSGKLLEAEIIPFTEGTISLTGPAKIFWNTIAANFLKRPDIVPSNILLLGPPGTGKSIAPKYLASLMGVPYIKLSNLGTEGLRGVALDKAMRVFEIIARNKPCVLHIDEIDKILPKHQPGWQSNNDEEVMAYIQDKLADTDFMKGIMVVGTSNEPLSLGDAMLRSGRFGVRIAMMPPTTLSEKIDVFGAVWNQIGSLREIKMPDERFIASLLSTTPDHATGADFRDRIEESARLLFSSENQDSLHEHLVTTFCRVFTKGDQYDRTYEASLALHNAWTLHDGKEDPMDLTEEQTYVRSVALILDSIHTSTAERNSVLEGCQQINTEIDATITNSLEDLKSLTEALAMLPETVREQMQSYMAEERRLLDRIQDERKILETKKGELDDSIQRHAAILAQSKDALTRIQHERAHIEEARRDQLIIQAVTGREPQPASKK